MSSPTLFRTEADIDRQRMERSGPIAVDTSLGTVQLRITGDLQGVETVWEAFQAVAPCTGTQTFGWAQAWARHVLGPNGHEPVIAVGSRPDGQVLFLWPFELSQRAGMKVLGWLGQGHANYNMGLFAPGTEAVLTAIDISRLLGAVARRTGAAAAILEAQPFELDGIANPFAKLPHQLTPSRGYAVKLGEFATLYEERFSKRSRRILNNKEKKLAEAGPLSYGWAATRDEVDTFFAQKARQFGAAGIKDIFDVHARAFYRDVALLESDNPGRLRLGYIKLDACSLADGDLQRQPPARCWSAIKSRKPAPTDSLFTISAPVPARIRSNGPTWLCSCSTASLPSSRRGSP